MSTWQERFEASERRKAFKGRVVAFLGGKCRICGYNRCQEALECHHPDPLEKEFNLSGRSSWTAAVEKELKAVVLLCVRCHREVHLGLHPTYYRPRDAHEPW